MIATTNRLLTDNAFVRLLAIGTGNAAPRKTTQRNGRNRLGTTSPDGDAEGVQESWQAGLEGPQGNPEGRSTPW